MVILLIRLTGLPAVPVIRVYVNFDRAERDELKEIFTTREMDFY